MNQHNNNTSDSPAVDKLCPHLSARVLPSKTERSPSMHFDIQQFWLIPIPHSSDFLRVMRKWHVFN